MSSKVPPALSGFYEFCKDFKWILVYIVGFPLSPAILRSLIGFRPPYPEGIREACLTTSVCTVVVLIFTFAFFERIPKRTSNILIGLSIVALIPLGMRYSIVTEGIVYKFDDQPDPIVGGSELLPEVAELISPTFTEKDALEGAEYNPFRVWEKRSILNNRSAILFTWIPFFCILSFYMAIFVLRERKRKRYSAPGKSKAPRKSKKK